MTVTLTSEQEKFIDAHAAELREKIAIGLDQIRNGHVIDSRKALEMIREKLRNKEAGK